MKPPITKTIVFTAFIALSAGLGSIVEGQRPAKRPTRATPPTFQPNDFAGVFFPQALEQLQGELPNKSGPTDGKPTGSPAENGQPMGDGSDAATSDDAPGLKGAAIWKSIISPSTLEELVKESKGRLDGMITTPAKFAGGGVTSARREFTLLGSAMAVIVQYPEEVKWQSSSEYAKRVFARTAANCKVGTQPVFNEAKQRQADLQTLLKGTKLTGNAEEVAWTDIADHGPVMQILEWALRENLAPLTNNENKFKDGQDEVLKYAELVAMYGQILQQEGMNNADDEQYVQMASAMTRAALDLAKAAKSSDAELARSSTSRVDQSCNKCHESYR
jgi:hypothetical protein